MGSVWWGRGNPSLLALLGRDFHRRRQTHRQLAWAAEARFPGCCLLVFIGVVKTYKGWQRRGGHGSSAPLLLAMPWCQGSVLLPMGTSSFSSHHGGRCLPKLPCDRLSLPACRSWTDLHTRLGLAAFYLFLFNLA